MHVIMIIHQTQCLHDTSTYIYTYYTVIHIIYDYIIYIVVITIDQLCLPLNNYIMLETHSIDSRLEAILLKRYY